MSDNKRKRLAGASPVLEQKAKYPRTVGFINRDQRLPASPPLAAQSGTNLMSTVRQRCRDAIDLLFGSSPIVLNEPCAISRNAQQQRQHQHHLVSAMKSTSTQPKISPSTRNLPTVFEKDVDGNSSTEIEDSASVEPARLRVSKRRRTSSLSDQVVPDGRNVIISPTSQTPHQRTSSSLMTSNASALTAVPKPPTMQLQSSSMEEESNQEVNNKRQSSLSPSISFRPPSAKSSPSLKPTINSPSRQMTKTPPLSCDKHNCVCANAIWTSSGVGPEIMLRTAEELSDKIVQMYGRVIDQSTNDINYAELSGSSDFRCYLSSARKLRYFDPLLLNPEERKAFFLNVYNSLMIHAITAISKPRTMFDRVSLYNSAAYNIGGRAYTLNQIEHGILRSNQCGNGPLAQTPFQDSDARILCSLPTVDPRIHFALNCGARSCPPVRFYEAKNLDSLLDSATRAYLLDVDVDVESKLITIPKLISWYRTDFCKNGDIDKILEWMIPYLESDKEKSISNLLKDKQTKQIPFKVVFSSYDWSVNDSSTRM